MGTGTHGLDPEDPRYPGPFSRVARLFLSRERLTCEMVSNESELAVSGIRES